MPDELVVGPVQARLTRYFAGREAEARSALIAALDSDRYLALLAAIDGLLADPPLTRRARGRGAPGAARRWSGGRTGASPSTCGRPTGSGRGRARRAVA